MLYKSETFYISLCASFCDYVLFSKFHLFPFLLRKYFQIKFLLSDIAAVSVVLFKEGDLTRAQTGR